MGGTWKILAPRLVPTSTLLGPFCNLTQCHIEGTLQQIGQVKIRIKPWRGDWLVDISSSWVYGLSGFIACDRLAIQLLIIFSHGSHNYFFCWHIQHLFHISNLINFYHFYPFELVTVSNAGWYENLRECCRGFPWLTLGYRCWRDWMVSFFLKAARL